MFKHIAFSFCFLKGGTMKNKSFPEKVGMFIGYVLMITIALMAVIIAMRAVWGFAMWAFNIY